MDNVDYTTDDLLGFGYGSNTRQRYPFLTSTTSNSWAMTYDQDLPQTDSPPSNMTMPNVTSSVASAGLQGMAMPSPQSNDIVGVEGEHPVSAGTATAPTTTSASLQNAALPFHPSLSMDPSAALLATTWNLQQTFPQNASLDPLSYPEVFNAALTSQAINFPASTQSALSSALPLASTDDAFAAFTAALEPTTMNAMAFQMQDFHDNLVNLPMTSEGLQTTDLVASSINSGSPSDTWLDVRSLSSSDNEWAAVELGRHRQSFDSPEMSNAAQVVNPQSLHVRTDSSSSQQSDIPHSAHSIGSFEEVPFPMSSPQSEHSLELTTTRQHPALSMMTHDNDPLYQQAYIQASVSPPSIVTEPVRHSPVSSTSPLSSGVSSPPATKGKKSPVGTKTTPKTIVKKTPAKRDSQTEKRVGRRKGPLRPDQRQQAHEIRKLRACLRCKFLKKTCDKGDPCAGCQPSHARLWQVPCTRIDIKDIAFFMKDWKADYERHVSLGFSVGNIKGFSPHERQLYITHGYGYYLPVTAREVFVRDDSCFGVDWIESAHERPREFEVATHRLSAGVEGIPASTLSEYLDRHLDGGFDHFVDEYFEGTIFLSELLKTAYHYYVREKSPVIRKALKLVLAYNLTLHVTLVDGLTEDERQVGLIDDVDSKFYNMTVAPVMINFQVKCALADMWRELQKDILEDLSSLVSSVYSGDKLKNWPTIFMLAAILLAIWEEMQFDCHYRVPDQEAVQKFCREMEATPVGVVVGLFSAISQKLPSFSEWDTQKHHHVLNSNPAICDAMTEVRGHIHRHERYLKSRSQAQFDRDDFDSLSNKFLSKLVIRAN